MSDVTSIWGIEQEGFDPDKTCIDDKGTETFEICGKRRFISGGTVMNRCRMDFGVLKMGI